MELHEVDALARELMAEHGLTGWDFAFDRARRRAGLANHTARRITLSRALMALYDEAQVRDTILHEIAHALVGPAHGHDAVWAAKARELGSSGERLVPADAPTVPGRWQGRCPAGHTVTRMQRPRQPMSCARCSRRFSPEHLLSWTFDGEPVGLAQISPSYARAWREMERRFGA